MSQFHGNLVIDEILHVQILAIGGLAVGPVIPQGLLHLVDAPVDVVHLVIGHLVIFGRLVLEIDVLVIVWCAPDVHGMVSGSVGHLVVGAVHLHDVATGNGVARQARVGQIDAVLALGNDLGEDVHAVIDAVQKHLAIAALGRVFHPWPRHLKGQQVAQHALVGIGCQQGPVVVLAHAQDFNLLFLAAFLERFVQRAERVGLLVTHTVGGAATIAQRHIALIVDGLPRMGHRIGIVEVAVAVVDNLHAGRDALVTVDVIAVHFNPHDGQIGGCECHVHVIGTIVVPP